MKTKKRWLGVGLVACGAWFGASVPSCGEEGSNGAGSSQQAPDIEGVIYGGGASDEALSAMLILETKADGAQGVVVDAPAAGATLPKDVPPTISWHVGGASVRREVLQEKRSASVVDRLGGWFGPREASAHGAPVNGRAYLLVFSTPSNPEVVRVFTTELEYTFDAASWTKIALENAPVTLAITNAIFEENRVAQDGGPFVGEPVTFSVGP
jgi:hypothetical protein